LHQCFCLGSADLNDSLRLAILPTAWLSAAISRRKLLLPACLPTKNHR
jgi:hypothetical protein